MSVDERIKWAGVSLVVAALFAIAYAAVRSPEALPRRLWARYVAYLERKLRRMFVKTSGATIAVAQVFALAVWTATAVLFGLKAWLVAVGIILALPAIVIERMRKARVRALEDQIDGYVLALANALKSTPSLADAIRSTRPLLRDPLAQEVELAEKEMRFGATLDQALLVMASRVGSRPLDTALSAMLIGRKVGGNLPRVLESTAASLREMSRLEAVVRTKTSEGRMQLWVLAVFPLVMVALLGAISPGYFDPLTGSVIGYVIVTAATIFWGSSLLLARKIFTVDL